MSLTGANQKMLDIARRLFWKKGYNAAGLRAFTDAYGCRLSNIYNLFRKIEDMLYAVLLEKMKQIIAPIEDLAIDEISHPEDQLRMAIKTHLAITLSFRRSAKLLFNVGMV